MSKMSKRKKGFTLVELLAVIVILAIIALIATPVVMNLINKSREKAADETLTEILKAGETYRTTELQDRSEECVYFDFWKNYDPGYSTELTNQTNPELEYIKGLEDEEQQKKKIIDEYGKYVTLIPISKLQLKGQIPNNGYMRVCKTKSPYARFTMNGKTVSGEYGDENSKVITNSSNLSPSDLIAPIIRSITSGRITSTTIQVIVAVDTVGKVEYEYSYKLPSEKEYKIADASDSNVFTYSKLQKDTKYDIKVKVINKKSGASGVKAKSFKTLAIDPVSATVTPSGWAVSKEMIINFDKNYKLRYKIFDGSTVKNETNEIESESVLGKKKFTVLGESQIRYCLIDQYGNVFYDQVVSIDKIDTTIPDVTNANIPNNVVTSNNITVLGACKDDESGIRYMSFSKDNGVTYSKPVANPNWIENVDKSSKTYNVGYKFVVNGGKSYTFKVKCINGAGETKEKVATMLDANGNPITNITAPEYDRPTIKDINPTSTGWAQSKTYEIDYRYETSEGFTHKFVAGNVDAILVSGEGKNLKVGQILKADQEYITTSKKVKIKFTSTGDDDVAILRATTVINKTNIPLETNSMIDRIDSTKPNMEVIVIDKEEKNGWYSKYITGLNYTNNIPSGIDKVYYKICTGSKCTSVGTDKELSTANGTYAAESNKERQYVCYQVVSKAGVKSNIACSEGALVDSNDFVVPTSSSIIKGESKKDKNDNTVAVIYDSFKAEYTSKATAVSGIAGYTCHITDSNGNIKSNGAWDGKVCNFSGLKEKNSDKTVYFKRCATNNAGLEQCSDVDSITVTGYCTKDNYIVNTDDTNDGTCGTYGECTKTCGGGKKYATKTYTTEITNTSYFNKILCSSTPSVREEVRGCESDCNKQACCNSCSCGDTTKCRELKITQQGGTFNTEPYGSRSVDGNVSTYANLKSINMTSSLNYHFNTYVKSLTFILNGSSTGEQYRSVYVDCSIDGTQKNLFNEHLPLKTKSNYKKTIDINGNVSYCIISTYDYTTRINEVTAIGGD